MNYKALDSKINFRYHHEKLSAIKSLGYSYISEAIIDLYINQKKSMPEIARSLKPSITQQVIGQWMKKWNIKCRPSGGNTSTFEQTWGKYCSLCGDLTEKGRRSYGMHDNCYTKVTRGKKKWGIRFLKSEEGLTHLKKGFENAKNANEKLLISALNKL